MKKTILILFCISFLFQGANLTGQTLITSELLDEFSLSQIQAIYGPFMQNGVRRYKVTYTTNDIYNMTDTASGLIIIPIREEISIYPLLCYQHGTVSERDDVPSNLRGGSWLSTAWGGLGYITAAADYLGLGEARGFHPYIHAASEASAAIDLLYATRQFVEENNYHLNDQLFITGYSQGGHAAVALHRSIQEDYPEDFTVTASAPMSGPYSISTMVEELLLGDEPYEYLAYIPFMLLSMNSVYNLGYEIEDIFKEAYTESIHAFYQGDINLNTLRSTLNNIVYEEEGSSPYPRYLFREDFLSSFEDNPEHPLAVALRANNVYDWAPEAPTRLYYCTADDQVSYLNSIVADSVMNDNGAPNVAAEDVNSDANHGECVLPAMTQAAIFFLPFQSISVGTSANPKSDNVQISPNPSTGYLYFRGLTEKADLRIFDIKGKLVFELQQFAPYEKINIQHLAKGVFFVQWTTKSGVKTKRLLVD